MSDPIAARVTAELASRLVSDRLGLLHELRERRVRADDLPIFDHVARRSAGRGEPGASPEAYGGGARSRLQSRAAAIGESLERYCLGTPNGLPHCWGTAREVPSPMLDPADLSWFLDVQYGAADFPFTRATERTPFLWTRGYSLRQRSEAWLPASLVYVPYRYRPGEVALSYPLSVGASCAPSPEAAALRAVLEIVERDALAICWESRTPCPPVPAEVVESLLPSGLPRGIELRSFDITTDLGIPVMLTLVLSPHQEPEVAVGTASDPDPHRALARSMEEAVTSWRSVGYLCRADPSPREQILARLRNTPSLADHALYHGRRGSREHFRFLLESPLPLRDPSDRATAARLGDDPLAGCARALVDGGYDVALFDLTHPEIAGMGLHVVRACIPGLVRQSVGLTARHLGNRRIRDVPVRLGYRSHPPEIGEMLGCPHPFP
jgi:ribosomal protein S12 methylthiotransferase accessory factor